MPTHNHNENRRKFLGFLGFGAVSTAVPNLIGCRTPSENRLMIPPVKISRADKVKVSEGLSYNLIARHGDRINQNQFFGDYNDYLCFFPEESNPNREGLLWVNHENLNLMFLHNRDDVSNRTKEEMELERKQVGGSLVRVSKAQGNGEWDLIPSNDNFRIDATTPIHFANDQEVAGSKIAIGTLANCSGGKTPWNTLLTAEENYDTFVGDQPKGKDFSPSKLGWEKEFNMPSEHYGWIVEIDPTNQSAKKHTSLGRCSHECATPHLDKNNTLVVYTGDDRVDQCLYKFIADKNDSLDKGTLHVANLKDGKWIPLDLEKSPKLQETFQSQIEVLTYLREAAKVVGGTPLDRPEDIKIDPLTGDVFVTLTQNKSKGNLFGSILKITESNEHGGLEFKSETYASGGPETQFACPDNICFDANGNLWFTSDIGSKDRKSEAFKFHGNNGLFLIPRIGPQKGEIIRVAQAPDGAEFTGPYFGPQGRNLFLSVQHPGTHSKSLKKLKSNWPNKEGEIPQSAVISIKGPLLDRISMNLKA